MKHAHKTKKLINPLKKEKSINQSFWGIQQGAHIAYQQLLIEVESIGKGEYELCKNKMNN